eukprot:SAG22_NODE_1069_length_5726_cov_20.690954_8_plen_79_part_00
MVGAAAAAAAALLPRLLLLLLLGWHPRLPRRAQLLAAALAARQVGRAPECRTDRPTARKGAVLDERERQWKHDRKGRA